MLKFIFHVAFYFELHIHFQKRFKTHLHSATDFHLSHLNSESSFSPNLVIDFLSLDVEGSELDILETVPWDKVDIR